MSAQAPAVVPGIDDKHDINGVEDIEQDGKNDGLNQNVIVTEEDVSSLSGIIQLILTASEQANPTKD